MAEIVWLKQRISSFITYNMIFMVPKIQCALIGMFTSVKLHLTIAAVKHVCTGILLFTKIIQNSERISMKKKNFIKSA